MKITAVRTRMERLELSRPYTIAFREVSDCVNGFVEIETDRGLTGYGCAAPEPFVTGESLEDCEAALAAERLHWLVGRSPVELPALCRRLAADTGAWPAARAAVDMALHDLLAQQLGVPLVTMLGRVHDSLPTSITIGIKPVPESIAEADEYIGRGFRILKVKLGHCLEEDVERLRRIREHCGPGIAIRVDPNQGYSAEDVNAFAEATRDLDIEFLEQPTAAGDLDLMRGFAPAVRDRIAADECLLNEADALRLVDSPRACGIFNIKLMKCGGVFAGLRIAAIAETAGVELMWGCMDESIVSISAALHAALASPATRYLDLDGSLDLARDVVEGGFVLEAGRMRTTQRPGLGVTPVA